VYRAIPARRERRRLVPALQPVLAPSPGTAAVTRFDDGREQFRAVTAAKAPR
jgi:hypothetical protein